MTLNIHYWLTVYYRSLIVKSKVMNKDRSFLNDWCTAAVGPGALARAWYASRVSWSRAPKMKFEPHLARMTGDAYKDDQRHLFPTRRQCVYVMQEISVWSSTRILLRKCWSCCMLERTWDSHGICKVIVLVCTHRCGCGVTICGACRIEHCAHCNIMVFDNEPGNISCLFISHVGTHVTIMWHVCGCGVSCIVG